MSRTARHTYKAKTKMYRKAGYSVKNRYPRRNSLGHGRHIIGCTCSLCKDGMHRTWGSAKIRRLVRSDRRKVRVALAGGEEPVNDKIAYGYTD